MTIYLTLGFLAGGLPACSWKDFLGGGGWCLSHLKLSQQNNSSGLFTVNHHCLGPLLWQRGTKYFSIHCIQKLINKYEKSVLILFLIDKSAWPSQSDIRKVINVSVTLCNGKKSFNEYNYISICCIKNCNKCIKKLF